MITLTTDSEILMSELKPKMFMKILARTKKCFSNYLPKSKYFDDSSKLVICKMKDETTGAAIEEFVRLK